MRFAIDAELLLVGESLRGALGTWEAPLEPVLGTWWDEDDAALRDAIADLGWVGLWEAPELLGAAVAGAFELGRVVAPLSLLDEATLGAALCVAGRVRHGGRGVAALVTRAGLTVGTLGGGLRETTFDGTGTLREVAVDGAVAPDGDARLHAWGAATLAYLAGLADAAVVLGIDHARSREQFGAPLGALPAVQGRLADAALARDGLLLAAWDAIDPEAGFPAETLSWAGSACRQATAHVLQVHGGIGFALEGGVHRWFRRAKTVQVWVDAVLAVRA